MKTLTKIYFPNLDGLRTIAFLLVFFQHGFWNSVAKLNIHSDFINRLIHGVLSGSIGVSVFFVLSGFLITYLLLIEWQVHQTINVPFFYIRRILRIWPLYYLVLLFAFVIYPYLKSRIGMDTHTDTRAAFYFAFLSNFDSIHTMRIKGENPLMEGVTWSVAIEEQFYLFWPLLIISFKKYNRFLFPFIIFISLLFRFINKDDGNVVYFHTLSVVSDLAVGGLCAYFGLASNRFKVFFQKLSSWKIVAGYIIGIAWLLYGDELLGSFDLVFRRLISSFFFAFIILEQNYSEHSFYKFFNSGLLTRCGKYTYGLYLLHPIALLFIDILLRVLKVNYTGSFLPLFAYGLACLAVSFAMAYFSYYYFELPFLRLKERYNLLRPGKPVTIKQ